MIYELYQEYYYFRPGITFAELLVSSSFVLLVIVLLRLLTKNKWSQLIVSGLIVEYIFIMISITILHRSVSPDRGASFIPFAFISDMRSDPYLISEKINNVFLFIPLGILLKLNTYKGEQLNGISILFVGFLSSLGIETTQYITHRGVFETDDVICNTLGCAVGAGMACLILRIYRIIVNGK